MTQFLVLLSSQSCFVIITFVAPGSGVPWGALAAEVADLLPVAEEHCGIVNRLQSAF